MFLEYFVTTYFYRLHFIMFFYAYIVYLNQHFMYDVDFIKCFAQCSMYLETLFVVNMMLCIV